MPWPPVRPPLDESSMLPIVERLAGTTTGITDKSHYDFGDSSVAIAQWAAQASAQATNEQEGAVATPLMKDNASLGERLVAHRAGESNLTLMLTRAHEELAQVNAVVIAKNETIARLNETLEDERETHREEMARLRSDLETVRDSQRKLEEALRVSRMRAVDSSNFVEHMQSESVHAMGQVNQQLDVKTREVQTLQERERTLTATIEGQRLQIDALSLELQYANQRGQQLVEELDAERERIKQMTEEIARRDVSLTELRENVDHLAAANRVLEEERERVVRDKVQLQAQVEDVRRTRQEELEVTQNKLQDL